jgi:hypothetical protein
LMMPVCVLVDVYPRAVRRARSPVAVGEIIVVVDVTVLPGRSHPRQSTVAAARKGMEKKSSRKSLPDGFKFNPRMVSRRWLDDGSTMARRAQRTNGLMARCLDGLDDGSTDLWLDISVAGCFLTARRWLDDG